MIRKKKTSHNIFLSLCLCWVFVFRPNKFSSSFYLFTSSWHSSVRCASLNCIIYHKCNDNEFRDKHTNSQIKTGKSKNFEQAKFSSVVFYSSLVWLLFTSCVFWCCFLFYFSLFVFRNYCYFNCSFVFMSAFRAFCENISWGESCCLFFRALPCSRISICLLDFQSPHNFQHTDKWLLCAGTHARLIKYNNNNYKFSNSAANRYDVSDMTVSNNAHAEQKGRNAIQHGMLAHWILFLHNGIEWLIANVINIPSKYDTVWFLFEQASDTRTHTLRWTLPLPLSGFKWIRFPSCTAHSHP